MNGWMIALTVIAAVIAFLTIAFFAIALISVRVVLGARKPLGDKKSAETFARFAIDPEWFDGVAERTERLTLKAFDGGSLSGLLIKQPEKTSRVAICCHGYGSSVKGVQVQAKLFYDRNFDVLAVTMRGHEGSSGRVGMAWLDRFDLARWVDAVIARYGADVEIALFGISMGGSTVVAYAGMNPPKNVKCVVEDCGFSSQRDIYLHRLKKVPLPIGLKLLPFTVGVKLIHGYAIDDADFVPLAKNIRIPALFIHGGADDFVPVEHGKTLYDACGSAQKSILVIDGAAHACAYSADPDKYTQAFTEFIDKNMPDVK